MRRCGVLRLAWHAGMLTSANLVGGGAGDGRALLLGGQPEGAADVHGRPGAAVSARPGGVIPAAALRGRAAAGAAL